MTRKSVRLAAAKVAAPIESPAPKAPRANARAAARAAASAAIAEEEARAAAVAEMEARILAAGTLRERQRQASRRYYAKHKEVVSARRKAEYQKAYGSLRRDVPPPPRPELPRVRLMREPRVEAPQEYGEHDEMQDYGNDHHQQDDNAPVLLDPKDGVTQAYLTQWIERNVKTKTTAANYKSSLSTVFRLGGCDDLFVCLTRDDALINRIIEGKQIDNPEKDYAVNSVKGYIQVVLFLIDKKVPGLDKIPADVRKVWKNGFSLYQATADAETKRRATDPDWGVFRYPLYVKKILAKYGKDSIQYLLTQLYAEIPMRDDFSDMKIKAYGTDDSEPGNYLILGDDTHPIRIIIGDYKTRGERYGVVKAVLPPLLNTLMNEHIDRYNLVPGKKLFKGGKVSTIVSKMNEEIGIPWYLGGVNYIRHSLISTTHEKGNPAENARLAQRMRHVIAQASNAYVRMLVTKYRKELLVKPAIAKAAKNPAAKKGKKKPAKPLRL